MESIVLLILFVFIIFYVMIRGAIEEKQTRKRYREKLKNNYGKLPDREYKQEEWNSIPRLYMHEQGEFSLDDITWNDLHMDQIFKLMNHTQSASGAEYLYAMLRKPKLDGKDMERLERHIQYFMSHEEERLDIQMILHQLGGTGKFSLSDYIDYLDTLGKRKNTRHYLCLLALAIAVILLFVSTQVGIVVLIAVMCFNVVVYLSEKKVVLPYVTTFGYILRMVNCADDMLKQPMTDVSDFKESLAVNAKSMDMFKKKYGLVFQMNVSTGNPIELVFEYIKMLTHIDLIQFNQILNLVQDNKDKIKSLVNDIGYLDSVIAIGAFRKSLPFYCVPELIETQHGMEIQGIASNESIPFAIEEGFHPALSNAVPNSFSQKRGMLLTGSNASGKSTFLKMVAINAILAQTVHTCAAKSYKGPMFRIYSSMSLRDNLEDGESYYIVEIKALKRIMDVAEADTENPLLCFVDEVLRGTNTVERIAASTQIMKKLAEKGIYCFAATHDIELTHLLENWYDNYHFEEEVKNGDVLFSYHLLEGRAHTRNAIKLLEVMGFSEDIIREADDMAAEFLKNGEWR